MLHLQGLRKAFCHDGVTEPVLHGIDITIDSGEICMIVGGNGSGKSTLMRCISGEYALDHGSVAIGGKDVTYCDRSHLIASVAQEINLGTIPSMTLLENMVLSRMRACGTGSFVLYDQHASDIRAIISEMSTDGFGVRLEQYLHRPIGMLSGGQRQVVATLMAISSKPAILLLDEHTSALDHKTHGLLMEYAMHHIVERRVTTLIVTHKLEDVIRYGDRIILLNNGKISLDLKGREKAAVSLGDLQGLLCMN